ncbi:hypothetical protein J6590_082233 [Homalodisca vitripennis]|nr:hypothetical protein J6590_082233 [Homalodisca vitripennis]
MEPLLRTRQIQNQGTKSWGVSEVKEMTELEPGAVCRITCFGRDCRYQRASQTEDRDKIVNCSRSITRTVIYRLSISKFIEIVIR